MDEICQDDLEQVCANIREKLVIGIEKRLVADAKSDFFSPEAGFVACVRSGSEKE